jgi:hypothetical protein
MKTSFGRFWGARTFFLLANRKTVLKLECGGRLIGALKRNNCTGISNVSMSTVNKLSFTTVRGMLHRS